MAEMCKDTCEVEQQTTPFKQEEARAASKRDKVRTGQGEKFTPKLLSSGTFSVYLLKL